MKFLRTVLSTQAISRSYFTPSVASEFFWKKNEKPFLDRLKEQYGSVRSNNSLRGADKPTTSSSKLNDDTTQHMMISMFTMHSINGSNHHLKSKSIHQDANDSNDSTSHSDYSSSYSSPSCSSSSSDSSSSD